MIATRTDGRRPRGRLLAHPVVRCGVALLLLVPLLAVGGCSEEQRGQRVKTVTVEETATPNADPEPTFHPLPRPADAIAYVENFYAVLNQYRYRTAWPLLPQTVRDEAISYADWRAGYRTNLTSQPSGLSVRDASKNAVAVSLNLRAKDIDACTGDGVTQWFSGTWYFVRAADEWAPQDISMKKVSGPTPATNLSGCTPTEPPPAPAEPEPYATPGYGGDLDCDDVGQTDFPVEAGDPNGFDADGDGIGCES